MYSSVEFGKSARGLSLPGDPYQDMEEAKAARIALMELGVFFYRDQYHGRGLILPNEENVQDVIGARVFRYAVVWETDNREFIRVSQWANPPAWRVRENGDAFAWVIWCEPCVCLDLNPDRVVCSS